MKTKTFFLLFSIGFVSTLSAYGTTTIVNECSTQMLQEPTLSIIEMLENGENYTIEITSIGCFNGKRQTVTVSKDDDIYTASFQDEIKVLSEEDIKAFITFESRLRSLEMGGCSTVDTYVLRFRRREFRTSDGTCSWNGGSKLLQIFV